jgi:KDO2-lipid IV(A) lauroyltransferase
MDEDTWMTAAATVINESMELLIRARPQQYLWGYHRYKAPRRLDGA